MNSKGLLHAFVLDGSGWGKDVTAEYKSQRDLEKCIIWFHFDYTSDQAIQWINNEPHLDSVSRDFLLTEDTRPRIISSNDALLLALRGVNLNPQSDPEDMVGVRVWANESMIITTMRRNLLSISDILTSLENGRGPKNTSEFIVDLLSHLISRMGPTIETMEEMLADVEEQILEIGDSRIRRQLSTIRRDIIVLRRYLAPQREAMYQLYEERISWLQRKDKIHSREVTNHLLRYIENLDSMRERALVIQEELANLMSEQLNSRMYVLSLITAVFLPLSFLTGLFGINVGGIPGSENKLAFAIFFGSLVVLALVLLFFFKRKRWM